MYKLPGRRGRPIAVITGSWVLGADSGICGRWRSSAFFSVPRGSRAPRRQARSGHSDVVLAQGCLCVLPFPAMLFVVPGKIRQSGNDYSSTHSFEILLTVNHGQEKHRKRKSHGPHTQRMFNFEEMWLALRYWQEVHIPRHGVSYDVIDHGRMLTWNTVCTSSAIGPEGGSQEGTKDRPFLLCRCGAFSSLGLCQICSENKKARWSKARSHCWKLGSPRQKHLTSAKPTETLERWITSRQMSSQQESAWEG